MIPFHDSPRVTHAPWVTRGLILANVVVFVYELLLGPNLDGFIARWGLVPAAVSAAVAGRGNPSALLTLVTAMFLHGGLLHIGGNMLFLWIFGDNVKDRLGHAPYLIFYFVCGIAANAAQIAFDPTSTVPSIGASGAMTGVLGAYLITYPGARVSVILTLLVFFTIVDVPAFIMIGFWFVTQLFSGVASLTPGSAASAEGVAWWAHVGGFITGIILMILLPKTPKPQPAYHGDVSFSRRAQEDTGLVGAAVGTVSLVGQLLEFLIIARVVLLFVGESLFYAILPVAEFVLAITDPLVAPFTSLFVLVRFMGHSIDLAGIFAVIVVYVITTAIIWVIGAMAYRQRPPRRV